MPYFYTSCVSCPVSAFVNRVIDRYVPRVRFGSDVITTKHRDLSTKRLLYEMSSEQWTGVVKKDLYTKNGTHLGQGKDRALKVKVKDAFKEQ